MNFEALFSADCIAVAQDYERVAKSIQPEPNASISKLTRLGSEDRGDELKPTHTIFWGINHPHLYWFILVDPPIYRWINHILVGMS